MSPQAENAGVKLCYQFDPSPLQVLADPDRVEQILLILLDNAMKHSPESTSIWVEGSTITMEAIENGSSSEDQIPYDLSEGQWALIRVTDSGEGVSGDNLPRVFDRFYRADESRSRDRGGSGLGLSIAKALVEAHGGHIWLDSPSKSARVEKDNPGTTASFALPLA
jgi:signal transduction histidine kinase